MAEQYDDSSDSARFNRPRWAAEWCTWLARFGGVASGNSQLKNDRRLKHLWNSGMVAADVRLIAGKVLLEQSMLTGEYVPSK
jgi:hypothetical protein